MVFVDAFDPLDIITRTQYHQESFPQRQCAEDVAKPALTVQRATIAKTGPQDTEITDQEAGVDSLTKWKCV